MQQAWARGTPSKSVSVAKVKGRGKESTDLRWSREKKLPGVAIEYMEINVTMKCGRVAVVI